MSASVTPDPTAVAKAEFDHIRQDHEYHPDRGLERVLADAPWVKREDLIEGLDAFHLERMAKVPDKAKYPESPAWVDYVLAVDREFQQMTGYTDFQMAIKRSLNQYLRFRGFAKVQPRTTDERCRVAYLPESDVGQIHIKNVDDPITHFKPRPPMKSMPQQGSLVLDGVGSGLHMDDEPEELFPLPVDAIRASVAEDVEGTVELFQRYSPFWGGCNRVVHDWEGNSVAIEKCSYNFMEVFRPGPDGRSHCSGMTCRDPDSPQGQYQMRKRREYLAKFGQPEDGPDMTFWKTCRKFEEKLSGGLRAMGDNPTWAALRDLFTSAWPDGLNKNGLKLHPDQGLVGYTLIVHASLYDKGQYYRWQRDPKTAKFPVEPEVYQFETEATAAS